MAKSQLAKSPAVKTPAIQSRAVKTQAKGQRKRYHLIEAAIRVVGRKGAARATIQDVAQEAGLSVGLANFYFAGKDELFRTAFQSMAEEYEVAWRRRVQELTEPLAVIDAMIQSAFDPQVLDQAKAAAWFSFWGEACAGDVSFQVTDQIEQSFTDEIMKQCLILARLQQRPAAEARDIGRTLEALIEGLWSGFAVPGNKLRITQAIRLCRQYIAQSFGSVAGPTVKPAAKRRPATSAKR